MHRIADLNISLLANFRNYKHGPCDENSRLYSNSTQWNARKYLDYKFQGNECFHSRPDVYYNTGVEPLRLLML